MKQILSIIAITLGLLCHTATAQQVVSTAGNQHQNEAGYIAWSLGEPVIQTFSADDYVLTQGFQQGDLSVTAINDMAEGNINILAYPNPTRNILNLKLDADNFNNYRYQLVNQQGVIIMQDKFSENHLQISLQNNSEGVYYLKIFEKDKPLKVFKVFKH